MKYILLGVCIILAISSFFSIPTNILENGKYKVIFKNGGDNSIFLSIKDEKFTKFFISGDSVIGKIRWINRNTFQFVDPKHIGPDTSTVLLKRIYKSFGEEVVEVRKRKGDTISFRTFYMKDVHFTNYMGFFVKMR